MNRSNGICECGCGQQTRLTPRTNRSKGWVKGQPLRYVRHHKRDKPGPLVPRLESKIEFTDGCWLWRGGQDGKGYGRVFVFGRGAMGAHVATYELLVGPVPEGLHLDHLCRTPLCVNPAHLEPVTNAENVRRGVRAKLNAGQVALIRDMIAMGHPNPTIGWIFGVNRGTIQDIRVGRTWTHA